MGSFVVVVVVTLSQHAVCCCVPNKVELVSMWLAVLCGVCTTNHSTLCADTGLVYIGFSKHVHVHVYCLYTHIHTSHIHMRGIINAGTVGSPVLFMHTIVHSLFHLALHGCGIFMWVDPYN